MKNVTKNELPSVEINSIELTMSIFDEVNETFELNQTPYISLEYATDVQKSYLNKTIETENLIGQELPERDLSLIINDLESIKSQFVSALEEVAKKSARSKNPVIQIAMPPKGQVRKLSGNQLYTNVPKKGENVTSLIKIEMVDNLPHFKNVQYLKPESTGAILVNGVDNLNPIALALVESTLKNNNDLPILNTATANGKEKYEFIQKHLVTEKYHLIPESWIVQNAKHLMAMYDQIRELDELIKTRTVQIKERIMAQSELAEKVTSTMPIELIKFAKTNKANLTAIEKTYNAQLTEYVQYAGNDPMLGFENIEDLYQSLVLSN